MRADPYRPAPARLALPGPRAAWTLGVAAVLCVELALVATAAGARMEEDPRPTLLLEARWLTLGARWSARLKSPPARRGETQRSEEALDAKVDEELETLFGVALAEDTRAAAARPAPSAEGPLGSSGRASDAILALALAAGRDALAHTLAARLENPEADIGAALVLLAQSPPPEAVQAAVDVARSSRWGLGWGPHARETLRARIYEIGGKHHEATRARRELAEHDATVLAGLGTLVLFTVIALILGLGGLMALGALGAQSLGTGRDVWAWLRRHLGGLPRDLPYVPDPLLVPLVLAAWLGASSLGSLLIGALPGAVRLGSFRLLLESMFAMCAAWVIVQWLSKRGRPLESARMLLFDRAPDGPRPLRPFTWALAAYCLLLPVMLVASALSNAVSLSPTTHPVARMLVDPMAPAELGLIALAVGIAAPVGEEILFRGLVFRALRSSHGQRVAYVASALLFAGLHMEPSAILPYLVLGLAFGAVYEATGTLIAPIALHAMWNVVVFAFVVLVGRA